MPVLSLQFVAFALYLTPLLYMFEKAWGEHISASSLFIPIFDPQCVNSISRCCIANYVRI